MRKYCDLTKEERELIRSKLDLTAFGFEKINDNVYKDAQFFRVHLGVWQAVFSSRHNTISVDYDKIDEFLSANGYSSQR